jgi:hypothetical protein
MESNNSYHLFFKYGLLGAGLIVMSAPLIFFAFPDAVEINGETGAMSPLEFIVSGIIGVILIVLFFLIKDKFAVVEIGNQTITIKHNGDVKTFQ